MQRLSEVDLARAKSYSGTQFADCVVECEFDGAVISYPAQLRPGRSLSTEHGLKHVLCGRIGEHFWEMRVGDLGEDGDVARVGLAKN